MAYLHTYALIKTLFDQSKDYFDALCPLVLGAVEEGSFSDLTLVQTKLKATYSIDVPIYILNTVCSRAKKQGFVEQENNTRRFKLIQAGRDHLGALEPVTDVQRRINAFLASLVSFYKKSGKQLDESGAQGLLELAYSASALLRGYRMGYRSISRRLVLRYPVSSAAG